MMREVAIRPGVMLLEWLVNGLRRQRRLFHKDDEEALTARVGREGEHLAYFHLRRLGYTVVARRWITEVVDGEVDLIAWHGNTLCFIEVKTRSRKDAFAAEFAVDEKKMRALKRMAEAYVRLVASSGRVEPDSIARRFDVISVYLQPGGRPEIQRMANAFR